MQNQKVTYPFLISLCLAEITRLKFGSGGMSLTNPKIERQARATFANMAEIPARAKPPVFLNAIRHTYNDNNMLDKFYGTLLKFKVNPADFSYSK